MRAILSGRDVAVPDTFRERLRLLFTCSRDGRTRLAVIAGLWPLGRWALTSRRSRRREVTDDDTQVGIMVDVLGGDGPCAAVAGIRAQAGPETLIVGQVASRALCMEAWAKASSMRITSRPARSSNDAAIEAR